MNDGADGSATLGDLAQQCHGGELFALR